MDNTAVDSKWLYDESQIEKTGLYICLMYGLGGYIVERLDMYIVCELGRKWGMKHPGEHYFAFHELHKKDIKWKKGPIPKKWGKYLINKSRPAPWIDYYGSIFLDRGRIGWQMDQYDYSYYAEIPYVETYSEITHREELLKLWIQQGKVKCE